MKILAFATAIFLALVPSASAHHTVAKTVNTSKLVSLTGVVTSVRWQNPHVIYHLSVPGEVGIDWEIESRHIAGMRRDGVEQGTIKVGDHVTMNVMLARDGSHHAATKSIVLTNGRTLHVCTVTYDACPS